MRSYPWCARPNQLSPDLPGCSYGSFEHHTLELRWKVRAKSGSGAARAMATSVPCPSAKGMASLFLSGFTSLISTSSNFCFLTGTGDLCCVAEVDNPMQQKWTKPMRAGPEVEWTEDLAL